MRQDMGRKGNHKVAELAHPVTGGEHETVAATGNFGEHFLWSGDDSEREKRTRQTRRAWGREWRGRGDEGCSEGGETVALPRGVTGAIDAR